MSLPKINKTKSEKERIVETKIRISAASRYTPSSKLALFSSRCCYFFLLSLFSVSVFGLLLMNTVVIHSIHCIYTKLYNNCSSAASGWMKYFCYKRAGVCLSAAWTQYRGTLHYRSRNKQTQTEQIVNRVLRYAGHSRRSVCLSRCLSARPFVWHQTYSFWKWIKIPFHSFPSNFFRFSRAISIMRCASHT